MRRRPASPTSAPEAPLARGATGTAVRDLQGRLAEVDLPCSDTPGSFGHATEAALRAFQRARGLTETGVCDPHTWTALIEAGYELGDRLLYRRDPMLRGDDVADLQRRLSALGFDPGRIDGIFGPETADAIREFQRNAGLPIDGMCGTRTLADLLRLQPPGGGDLVSPLRERLLVGRGDASLASRFVAVGEPGGFAAGAAALCRSLRLAGARALELHDPEPQAQARAANTARTDCFVSLRIDPDRTSCITAFYSGFQYESLASRELAEIVQAVLPAAIGVDDGGTCGMALPILRETRMPAIEIQLGDPSRVVEQTPMLARTVVDALASWVALNFS